MVNPYTSGFMHMSARIPARTPGFMHTSVKGWPSFFRPSRLCFRTVDKFARLEFGTLWRMVVCVVVSGLVGFCVFTYCVHGRRVSA